MYFLGVFRLTLKLFMAVQFSPSKPFSNLESLFLTFKRLPIWKTSMYIGMYVPLSRDVCMYVCMYVC
jgi:hypothetical protein